MAYLNPVDWRKKWERKGMWAGDLEVVNTRELTYTDDNGIHRSGTRVTLGRDVQKPLWGTEKVFNTYEIKTPPSAIRGADEIVLGGPENLRGYGGIISIHTATNGEKITVRKGFKVL